MNRNVESHFAELPKIDIERSIFDRSCSHKTSFDCSEIIPFYIDEVLPADTFNVTTSCVVRLQTPLTPIMDNIYMDTYYFFVPMRLVWTHTKQFFGENSESAWLPQTEYTIPTITAPSGGFAEGTIADYLGIPINVQFDSLEKGVSALPFRAVALCMNEWFRDQNLTDPLVINLGDETTQGVNTDNYITDVAKGGKPFKAAKFHDYFTSCLPSPQKGEDVTFPLISGTMAPVGTRSDSAADKFHSGFGNIALAWKPSGNETFDKNSRYQIYGNVSANYNIINSHAKKDTNLTAGISINPENLWADLADTVGAVTINQMRLAFQLQKFYEKISRSGSRYRELLREMFSVQSSDARMMIPEYLGGHRFPLSIHQVANQAQSSGENDFLGDLGAMSNTADVHEDFVKSFEEHGFVIGFAVVRYDHSYPQGLERFWRRSTRTDFYWPVFANIGEQPVYKTEICLAANQTGKEVFGYQEAWAEYRYKPSRCSSSMRPQAAQSLASWHLADNYQSVPSLSDSWIREDKTNVDRVLSVTSSVANQVFCDFYIKNICTRPLPMYSIPGLIDHH